MNLDELAQKYGGSQIQTGLSKFDELASKYGGAAVDQPPPAPVKDAGFSFGDIAKAFGVGAAGSTKALADVAGAENVVSSKLGSAVESLQQSMTPERQAEMQRQAERMKAAEESGSTLQEVKAGALNVLEAPLQSTAQAIGSFVPYLLSTPIGLGLRLTGASKAVIAAVAKEAPRAIATAQGAGAVKGSIYDGVLQAEIEAGVDPELAKQKATAAQDYFGKNFDQIALGLGLGRVAGSTGVEKLLTPAGRVGAAQGMGRRIGEAVITESLPEAAQGGQERLAQNIALQREGRDVDTFRGVAGAATQEALTGALGAAPLAAIARPPPKPDASVEAFKKEEDAFRKQFGTAEPVAAPTETPPVAEPPTEFPGGYTATRREVSRQDVPESFGIFAEGSDKPLTTVTKQEEADAKLQSLSEIRQEEQARLLAESDKITKSIFDEQRKLEVMEATGQTDTDQYVQSKALLEQRKDEAAQQIKDINDKIASYSAPLKATPIGVRTDIQNEFNVSRGAEPVGTFSTLEQVEAMLRERDPEPFKQAEIAARKKELDKKLRPLITKFNLGDVGLNVVDQLERNAGGRYLDQLIEVSLEEANPLQTMRHESLHALKDLGFFTPQQWKALTERAEKDWIVNLKKTPYEEGVTRYDAYLDMFTKEGQGKGLTGPALQQYANEALIEEAIADAFGAYDKGDTPPPGMIAALFKKLKDFFMNFGQALRGAGFESSEDIFQRVERGELKSRKPKAPEKNISAAPAKKPANQDTVATAPKKEEKDEASIRPTEPAVRPSPRGREKFALRGERRGQREDSRFTPLALAPSVEGFYGPDPRIVEVAERFAQENGIDLKRQAEYVQVEGNKDAEDRAKRIAKAYEDMRHDPQNPEVKEAYQNLINQTIAQYKALVDAGYKFWFIDLNNSDNLNYLSSPWNALRDIRSNKQMGIFPTNVGFGSNESFDPSDNPLLQETNFEWPIGGIDGPKQKVLANDVFRAVHDAFGHGLEGAGFRATGEENAWQAHSRLFTGSALKAITSETRGQNSFVNYGPNGEFNRKASTADTKYADQKVGLMPAWTWNEGLSADEPSFTELNSKTEAKKFLNAVKRVKTGRPYAFPLHVHDLDTYENARLFLSEDGESGFALIGDEIGSFFSGGRGQAYPTLRLAVNEGGRRIDTYRTKLPSVMGKAHFRPVARVEFNAELATPLWDKSKFKQFQNGKPDLVFYAYDPSFNVSGNKDAGDLATSEAPLVEYDEAVILQKEAVKKAKYSLQGITLGEKQPEAQSFKGTHYGNAKVDKLAGSKYGTGIRGAERRRLDDAFDDRIKRRAYFYVAKEDGTMPLPESGLGGYVYTQKFDNILGPGKEMSRLFSQARGDSNDFETNVIDAGYDGYAVPSMGMMVILNHDVPVNYEGTRAEIQNSGKKYSLRTNFPSVKEVKEAVAQAKVPKTEEFKRFIAGNQWVDEDGDPKVFYHATAREFVEFDTDAKVIYLSDTPEASEPFGKVAEDRLRQEIYQALNKKEKLDFFQRVVDDAVKADKMSEAEASDFIRKANRKIPDYGKFGDIDKEVMKALIDLSPTRMSIMPLYVRAETPFDFENKEHVAQVMAWVENNIERKGDFPDKTFNALKGSVVQGTPQAIEGDAVQKGIKRFGFDGYTLRKRGQEKSYAVYKPTQVKSVTGNLGEYDREAKDIRYSLPNIPANVQNRIDESVTKRVEKGFAQRMIEAISPRSAASFRAGALNRYNQLSEYDKKLAEQMGGPGLLADQSAESAALMSDLGAGIAASAMGYGDRNGGIPVLRNGITTIDTKVKGLIASLAPLAASGDSAIYQRYQYWAMVKRGQRLNSQGKITGIDTADVAFAKALEQKHPEFVSVQKDLIAFNNGLVKYMVDTGVLSQSRGAEYVKYADYVPFYRQMDGETTLGPNLFASLSGVKPPKKLKGAVIEEAPLADFLETMVRNTQSSIQAGIKNYAAQRTINVVSQVKAPGMGATRLNTPSTAPNTISVLEKGVLVSYETPDNLLVEAVKSLNMNELPFMGIIAGPANLLRSLVTRDPGFMMANLLRDSLSAYVTSGVKMTPIADTVMSFGKSLARKSTGFEALLNAGIIGGYEFSENVERSGRMLGEDLEKKTGTRKDARVLRPFKSLWDALETGTTASDAATRAVIYDRVLAETGNEAEALYRALEVMNFHRKGNSALIRVLTAAVPFFNARLQGLDLFYRASTGNMNNKDAAAIQRQFWARGMTMMALSAAYWFMVSDEEEYKKQEQETRDNNWLIPSLGIRIPIPFEVGVLFKTIPERIMAYSFGDDTGKDLRDSLFRNAMSTFAFNPIPQTVKPILEASFNFNTFTWRPIVSEGMKDIAPEYQVGPSTSIAAKGLAQALGLSPIKVDHIIKGYVGTMGMYGIDTIDMVLDQFGDSPKATKRFEQLPVIKRFALDKEARGNVTQYYELKDAVDTVVRTINLLEKTGESEEYVEYLTKNQGTLAFKDYIQDTEKTMKSLREMRTAIRTSQMDGDEKRDALLEISKAESAITSEIQTIKKAISSAQ
jgi:hypothetical protein